MQGGSSAQPTLEPILLQRPDPSVRAEVLPAKVPTLPVPFTTTDNPVRQPDRAPHQEPETEPRIEPRTLESRGQSASISTPSNAPVPEKTGAMVSESIRVPSPVVSMDRATVTAPGPESGVGPTEDAVPPSLEIRAHLKPALTTEAPPASVTEGNPVVASVVSLSRETPRVAAGPRPRVDGIERGVRDPIAAQGDLPAKTQTPALSIQSFESAPEPLVRSLVTEASSAIGSRSEQSSVASLSPLATSQPKDHQGVAEQILQPVSMKRTVSSDSATVAQLLPSESPIEPDAELRSGLVEVMRNHAESSVESAPTEVEVKRSPASPNGDSVPAAAIPLDRAGEPSEKRVDAPRLDRMDLRGQEITPSTVRRPMQSPAATELSKGDPAQTTVGSMPSRTENEPVVDTVVESVEPHARLREARRVSSSAASSDPAVLVNSAPSPTELVPQDGVHSPIAQVRERVLVKPETSPGRKALSVTDRSASAASIPAASATVSTPQVSAVRPENLNSNPSPSEIHPAFVREALSAKTSTVVTAAVVPGPVFDNAVPAQTSPTQTSAEGRDAVVGQDASSKSTVDADSTPLARRIHAQDFPSSDPQRSVPESIPPRVEKSLESNPPGVFVGQIEVPGRVEDVRSNPVATTSSSEPEVALGQENPPTSARPGSVTRSETGNARMDSENVVDSPIPPSRPELTRAAIPEFISRREIAPKGGHEILVQSNDSIARPERRSESREGVVSSDPFNPVVLATTTTARATSTPPAASTSAPAPIGMAMETPVSHHEPEPASVRMQVERIVANDTAGLVEARPLVTTAPVGSVLDSQAGTADRDSGQRKHGETPRQPSEAPAPVPTVSRTVVEAQPGFGRGSAHTESQPVSSMFPRVASVAPATLESRSLSARATHSHHALESRGLELGTPAAFNQGNMAYEPKADNIAGTGAQALPGEATHRGSSPDGFERPAMPLATLESANVAAVLPPSLLDAPNQTDSTPATHSVRMYESVDRLQSMMATHASSVVGGHLDELRAVLRPDSGTEIHLHVRREADRVEMTARCQGGDVAAWQSSWSDLQQRLRSQGVSLQALEIGSRTPNSGLGAGANPDRQSPQSRTLADDGRESGRRESPTGRRPQGEPATQQEMVTRRPARRVTPRVAEYWA